MMEMRGVDENIILFAVFTFTIYKKFFKKYYMMPRTFYAFSYCKKTSTLRPVRNGEISIIKRLPNCVFWHCFCLGFLAVLMLKRLVKDSFCNI